MTKRISKEGYMAGLKNTYEVPCLFLIDKKGVSRGHLVWMCMLVIGGAG